MNETTKRITESECSTNVDGRRLSKRANSLWIIPFLQIFAVYVLHLLKRMKVLEGSDYSALETYGCIKTV